MSEPPSARPLCHPYPGLRPFRADESHLFFGRDEQSGELLERLQKQRFLGVVGASGCGKSSLVRAGLISGLRAGYLANAGVRWLIAEMRPGGHPMRRLAEALLAPEVLGAARAGEPEAIDALQAVLRRGPRGLEEALQETPLPERTNLLILVDQFEEIFRFRAQGDPDEADAFVALLIRAAEQLEFPVYVVLTMRSDYLGDCALFRGLPETLNDSQFLTPRLTREQCSEAIVGPACVCEGVVEPEIVSTLLNDIGTEQDQLPLLQHALMRLWEETEPDPDGIRRLTLAHYRDVGGLTAFLSQHADAVYLEALPDDEARRVASILFRALSGGDPGRPDTRLPVRLDYVAEVAGVAWERVAEVVEVFRQEGRNFLMPPPEVPLTPDTVLDIAHESLIRQWALLREWVAEEARLAGRFHQIVLRAREEHEGSGNLLIPPPLERALQWREEHPGHAWARRYETETDYDLTLAYIQRSQAAWEQEVRRLEEEKKRQEAVEQQRREDEEKQSRTRFLFRYAVLGAALATILLAVTGFVVWRAHAETTKAQMETKAALKEKETAEQAKLDAQAAERAAVIEKRTAERAVEKAKEEQVKAETAKTKAEAAKAKAEEDKKKADIAIKSAETKRKEADKTLANVEAQLASNQQDLQSYRTGLNKLRTVLGDALLRQLSLDNLVKTFRDTADKFNKDYDYVRAGDTLAEGWRQLRKREGAGQQANRLLQEAKDAYQKAIDRYRRGPTRALSTARRSLPDYRQALRGLSSLLIESSSRTGPAKFDTAIQLEEGELGFMETKGDIEAQIEIHNLLTDLYGQAGDDKQRDAHQKTAADLRTRLNEQKTNTKQAGA